MGELGSWLRENILYLLLLLATVFDMVWLLLCRERLHLRWPTAALFSVLHTVIGVACVKLFAIVEAGFDLGAAGNMSLFGGVFFLPPFYYVGARITRQKMSDMFDVFTICMILTLFCARINCMVSGCCTGSFIPGLSIRWPTRELELIFYLILLFWLGHMVRKGRHPGQIYPLYMISYGVFRFIVEWFRTYDNESLLHRGHVWALISLIVGLSFYYTLREKETNKRRVQKK